MVATLLLLALVCTAAITDWKEHRIYNSTTYPGIVAALVLNVAGSITEWISGTDPRFREWFGWIGWDASLLGLLACFGVMLVCFVLFQTGGGDVKLIAMMGAFLGPRLGIEAMLWTFVIGAAAAVIILIWQYGAFSLLQRTGRHLLWTLRLGRWAQLMPEERVALKQGLPLGPSAPLAVLIVKLSHGSTYLT